jgi:hypothetical protein
MGILRTCVTLLPIVANACYSPELRDCTLTCSAATDCADGQVCGSDHFCAAPGIAGRCTSLPGDAGSRDRDAGTDAAKIDARPDAPAYVALAISIEGKGRVVVQTIGTCEQVAPQNGHCTFPAPINMTVTAQAQAYSDQRFEKWTTAPCALTPLATCTFTPAAATTIGVKFRKDD